MIIFRKILRFFFKFRRASTHSRQADVWVSREAVDLFPFESAVEIENVGRVSNQRQWQTIWRAVATNHANRDIWSSVKDFESPLGITFSVYFSHLFHCNRLKNKFKQLLRKVYIVCTASKRLHPTQRRAPRRTARGTWELREGVEKGKLAMGDEVKDELAEEGVLPGEPVASVVL